ncbi:MAG: 1-deoxy-D-xylulose-5-phosphate synthase [Candidatus Izemoplasmataceae bacterium]
MKINDINDPSFLKSLSVNELKTLSDSIRQFLIEHISQTGGHLSSNLGIVELTVAIHKVFDSPKDQILFDVGHQAYVHKILTGRANQFDTLRKTDGLSGFLKREESEHDILEAGHSSTSLGVGLGLLYAKNIDPSIGHVVMIIGDGALANGVSLESLNVMGHDTSKAPIIILNDNEMSISKNVGYLAKVFTKLRLKRSVRVIKRSTKKVVPKFLRGFASKMEKRLRGFITGQSYFEDQGYEYYGPIDGHDYKALLKVLSVAKNAHKPCIIHVRTIKGKGYGPSELDAVGKWHGVCAFEVDSGDFLKEETEKISYSLSVSRYLQEKAKLDKNFYVITPAMIGGSELYEFYEAYNDRLIDVGIAEQTALLLASGLALKKIKVFVSIYSTFLQRAYDHILHDIARMNLNVIIGIDRAGLVGGDGETHQGIYDIPMLAHIPNTTIAHPKDALELQGLLNYAFLHEGLIAIRYPKDLVDHIGFDETPIYPSWEIITKGNQATIITFGSRINELEKHIKENNYPYTLINARYIKPLDYNILDQVDRSKPIITVEESTLTGGLGSMIRDYYSDRDLQVYKFKRLGFHEAFVPQGDISTMLKRYNLDSESILKVVASLCD